MADVQHMIDAALQPVLAQLAVAVLIGDSIALQSSGDQARVGKFLCAEHGGPRQDGEPFDLTGRSSVAIWESWIVARGNPDVQT